MNNNKAFTIIELIVVIAIIAILATIVTSSVTYYFGQAKKARANADFSNIIKALSLFKTTYGDYPYSGSNGEGTTKYFYGSNSIGGPGYDNPSLTFGGATHPLSEFYKSDYNANYFAKNGYYHIILWDNNSDGTIDCAAVRLVVNTLTNQEYYAQKRFVEELCLSGWTYIDHWPPHLPPDYYWH